MAVDAAAYPTPAASGGLVARVAALPVRLVLAGLVAGSVALRWLLGTFHATPSYLPDEYIYATLAHGIATTGLPSVRGEPAAFPALLEPLLAAPLWLQGDPDVAYRLTQGLHALTVSLAAVPAYLLARRLGAGGGLALGVSVLALAWPGLAFTGWMLADPVAYPLVVASVYAGVRALEAPSRRWQLAFLGLAGLTTLARVQYVVLPLVFLAAGLAVERFRLRAAARTVAPTLALLGAALAAGLAAGPERALGYYAGILKLEWDPARILLWAGNDLMVAAYAAGWVIVPGGLVGLALALARPRTRAEAAFAALAVGLTACVVGQAALYSANGNDAQSRVHERYTFPLLTLLAVGFALYLSRGPRARKAAALPALGLLVLSAVVPLSGYTAAQGKTDSPTLRSVFALQLEWGVADGALAVAAVAGLLSLVAVAVAFARAPGGVALALAGGACALLAWGAYAFDRQNTRNLERGYFDGDHSWVADAAPGPVALLRLPGGEPGRPLMQLFWNRNVERVLLLGAERPDSFGYEPAAIAPDGRLVAGDRPVGGTLLVERWSSQAELEGVERVAERPDFELVRSRGTVRVRLLADGLHADGWLAPTGAITVWPRTRGGLLEGTLRLAFSMPAGVRPEPLHLYGGGVRRTVVVPPGRTTVVELPVRRRGLFRLRYVSDAPGWLDAERRVSVMAERPRFVDANHSSEGSDVRS